MASVLGTVRGVNVAPGIYTKVTEIRPSGNNSIGITTLGLVGETLRGAAFTPTPVANWREFVDSFGGTSTEHFRGSKYPRYELPYIAQDYLTESNQLFVTRVLGLSGYNAGRAWLITSVGSGEGDNMLVAVLRSRGTFVQTIGNPSFSSEEVLPNDLELNVQYVVARTDPQDNTTPLTDDDFVLLNPNTPNERRLTFGQTFFFTEGMVVSVNSPGNLLAIRGYCGTVFDYDQLLWDVENVQISPASIDSANFTCGKAGTWSGIDVSGIPSTPNDFGTFRLTITLRDNNPGSNVVETIEYTVSLNPGAKNFISNVLGSHPQDNSAPLFVEELYDVALQQLIFKAGTDPVNFITGISMPPPSPDDTPGLHSLEVSGTDSFRIPAFRPVASVLTQPSQILTRSMLNQRFLYTGYDINGNEFITQFIDERITITSNPFNRMEDRSTNMLSAADIGKILTVRESVDASGRITYVYVYTTTITDGVPVSERLELLPGGRHDEFGFYPQFVFVQNEDLFYRLVSAEPLVVSRVVGDISDYREQYRYASSPWVVSEMIGTFANNEVRRLFRFHTITDGNSANDLIKISIQNIDIDNLTFDVIVRDFYDSDASILRLESFPRCSLNPNSSNYILNRIGDFNNSTPARSRYILVEMADNENIASSVPCGFLGYPVRELGGIQKPALAYNVTLNEEMRIGRQYFGMSDLIGIDNDILSYKGRTAYTDGSFTNGFHLDSRISDENTLVDGENPNNIFTWQTVSVDEVGRGGNAPQITGDDVLGTIYEDTITRKFTFCFYGGFDGWDEYRTARTTGDNFKMNRYRGKINPNTGQGEHFSLIRDAGLLRIPGRAITSDFYAYLAGILSFNNPSETPINVFATPGIDYVNDTLLVGEAIDMIEEPTHQRCIYFVTTPDKPFGASDSVSEMYTPQDAVDNLEGTEISTSYAATYYPWARYFDPVENKTIFLPPTRDVVRSVANIDRTSFAWFAPSGDVRGRMNGGIARINLKVEDENTLYAGRINYLKTFAREGTFLWGQKNLQLSFDNDREHLTRIGVHRMMLRIRELVIRSNRQLLFTPNDTTVRQKFISNTSAILNDVRSNRGISEYRIEVENSIEALEARTLPALIWIRPIGLLEFIEINFNITGEGVSFDAV